MLTMEERRRKLGLTQAQLSKLADIHATTLCQIETGWRLPTPNQRLHLHQILGPLTFRGEEGDEEMPYRNVPAMPAINNEETHETVRDQLQRLLDGKHYDFQLDPSAGDFATIREIYQNSTIFEVFKDGKATIYHQDYLVGDDGKVSLQADPQEAKVIYETLSRRRIHKEGVPDMPTGHYEGEGTKRLFVLDEQD